MVFLAVVTTPKEKSDRVLLFSGASPRPASAHQSAVMVLAKMRLAKGTVTLPEEAAPVLPAKGDSNSSTGRPRPRLLPRATKHLIMVIILLPGWND